MQLGHNFFDDYRFEPAALPEIDLAEIDTRVEFLGRPLAAPLLISSMTGGTAKAGEINRNLARGAERTGVALGVGSQRKALEDPAKADTFRVREVAPEVVLLANLGAVQLNYGMGVAECRQAIEMIGADALILHLNALQEALQPEGQGNFSALLPKIGEVVRELGSPVVVKEIGCGISESTARALAGAGVRIVDTAGVGGRAGRASRPSAPATSRSASCSPAGGCRRLSRSGTCAASRVIRRSPAAGSATGSTSPRRSPSAPISRASLILSSRRLSSRRSGSPRRCGAPCASSRSVCSASG